MLGRSGKRTLPFADLHRLPGATPHVETNLRPGELITAFLVPGGPRRRSLYRKIRDRESYAFANASAAVALDLDGDVVRDVRIGLGGVATIPWRARRRRTLLRGQTLTEAARAAAEAEFGDAKTREHNGYKVALGKATMVRALLDAQAMEVLLMDRTDTPRPRRRPPPTWGRRSAVLRVDGEGHRQAGLRRRRAGRRAAPRVFPDQRHRARPAPFDRHRVRRGAGGGRQGLHPSERTPQDPDGLHPEGRLRL